MKRSMTRMLCLAVLGFVLAVAAVGTADAHGWRHRHHHGHTSLTLGFHFGVPSYSYYYPPPVNYAPPPRVIYVEPQRYRHCRRFRGDATVDASGERFYGTACLGRDGRWHIAD